VLEHSDGNLHHSSTTKNSEALGLYHQPASLSKKESEVYYADHNMIMKIYAHLSEEQEKAAYKKLINGVNKLYGGQNRGQTEAE